MWHISSVFLTNTIYRCNHGPYDISQVSYFLAFLWVSCLVPRTTDCVIPGNQTASSVKLIPSSSVISEEFHLKLGFHVINVTLTLHLLQLKCTFLKTKLASSFLAHHKLIHRCSKVTLYILLSHRFIGNMYLSQLSFLKMQNHQLFP